MGTDCDNEFSQQGQSMDNAVTWILGLGLVLFMSLTCFEAYSRPEPTLYQPKQDQTVIEGRGEYFYDEAGKLRFQLFKW